MLAEMLEGSRKGCVRTLQYSQHTISENLITYKDTALKLFELKISPIASYGIEIIWPHH
jgi:hypothetical protein